MIVQIHEVVMASRTNFFLFYLSYLWLVGCSSSTFEETSSDTIESNNTTNLRYADRAPQMDDQGEKIIYIAGNEESKLRVYRYSVSDGSKAVVTSTDSERDEFIGRVSPDGTYIAYVWKSVSDVGNPQYSVQVSLWDMTGLTQVFPDAGQSFTGSISEIQFDPDSNGLVIQTLESNETRQYLVSLANSNGSISSSKSSAFANGESDPKFVKIDTSIYAVTQSKSNSGTEFKFYTVNFSGVPSAALDASRTRSIDAQSTNFYGLSSTHIFYEQMMSSKRTKERLGDVDPSSDGSSQRGYQSPTRGVSSLANAGNSTLTYFDKSEYLPWDPLRVWDVRVVNSEVLAILGIDRYICNNSSLSLSTILLYSNTESSSGLLPLLVTKDRNSNEINGLSAAGCSSTLADTLSSDQPLVSRIASIDIRLVSDEYKILIESREADDGEVYLLNLKFGNFESGENLEVNVTNISSNLPESN